MVDGVLQVRLVALAPRHTGSTARPIESNRRQSTGARSDLTGWVGLDVRTGQPVTSTDLLFHRLNKTEDWDMEFRGRGSGRRGLQVEAKATIILEQLWTYQTSTEVASLTSLHFPVLTLRHWRTH